MDKTIQTLTEVLQMSKEGTKPYDTTAEVVRIEGQTAWVHIPGGIDETPVSMTIDARVGDIVQVRVSGGRAWITGNASAPPTDDTVAKVANRKATDASKTADNAQVTAENAELLASKANAAAQNVNQYFWHTETDTGAGAGAHITEVTQDEFLDDPDNGGGNLLAKSGGIFIRDGLQELATMTANGQTFNNEHSVPVFVNGRTETRTHTKNEWFYYNDESPLECVLNWNVDSIVGVYGYIAGLDNVYTVSAADYSLDGRTLTIDATACTAMTAMSVRYVVVEYTAEGQFPFLTFGTRAIWAQTGTYSVSFGANNSARGARSTAFGESNIASGMNSFVTGNENTASYRNSVAFGKGNTTMLTEQFVIGRYGNPSIDKLFIVGNGTSENNWSTAFSVAENGNVVANGEITDGNGFVLGRLPIASMAVACSTNMNIASSTWRSINAFTGYTKTVNYIDTDFFTNDTNGFKTLKKGIYRLTSVNHVSGASAGNAYAVRFYDYTASTGLGNVCFCNADSVTWSDVANETVAEIEADHIIVPQWERYSGSANWKPQTATFTIQLIKLT